MARKFSGSSANYLEALARAPLNALPVTISAWVSPNLTLINGATSAFLSIGPSAAANRLQCTVTGTVGNETFQFSARNTSDVSGAAQSPTGLKNNTWAHFAGVTPSTTSRTAYLNGVAGTTNTTSIDSTPSAWSRTVIGARRDSVGIGLPIFAEVADVAIWNIELTTREIQLLATGVSPLRIRPDKLVAYWPLNGRVGSGEASLISELDYANAFGTVPVVTDPIAELRKRARRSPTLLVASPYPILSNLQATRGNTSAALRTNINY